MANERVETIISELMAYQQADKQEILPRFFKTGKGEYGEGDRFMGVSVPQVRLISKRNRDISLDEVEQLLASPWHEARQCALFILTLQYQRAKAEERKTIVDFYLSHTDRINNWDLVDVSAHYILGDYLLSHSREILYRLAESPSLWENRIAMVSTYAFIRKGELDDTYTLATRMMHHPHDLMHKAIGWMLREAGKKDVERLTRYVKQYAGQMPRTMLRYAIEKLEDGLRQEIMKIPRLKK
ncbi:MAG: DNA alkylation repair protein [Prevotella sp.]|nr:DNA alkylation repair protein [Prevotella sp.]